MVNESKKDEPQTVPEKKSGVTAPELSLPKGGGAIRGIGEKFSVNPVTGTGSMSVPIAASPGRGGFGPQLALSYDSGSGNGPFGFGWHLALPSISRKTDKGLPTYHDAQESDVFLISGAEDLVPMMIDKGDGTWEMATDSARIVGGYTYDIQYYRPRIEGLFASIERWTSKTDSTDIFWRSMSRDNVTTFYGKDETARIVDPDDPTHIFSWLICETYDDKGNVMRYEYEKEDHVNVDNTQLPECNRENPANAYIKSIKYGNNPSRLHRQYEETPENKKWLFQLVFDYGEGHYAEKKPDADGRIFVSAATTNPVNSWPIRKDPFSSYRSGFEVRTYRLCQRVLMFHQFPELNEGKPLSEKSKPVLVRSTDFNFEENSTFTFLKSATHTAYQDFSDKGLLKKSLPPTEFIYSVIPSASELANTTKYPIEKITGDSLKNLPIGLDSTSYQWVDLDGEGISGVLAEQMGAWYYKRNLGDGKFDQMETLVSRPAIAERGTHQLMALSGNGQLDVVVAEPGFAGFMERLLDDTWDEFRPFQSMPTISWRDPNLRFFDLTGDGLADLVISEHEAFIWHQSLGKQGFAPAERVAKLFDKEKGPHLVFADGTQTIFIADMSGDGLTDLVRIRNGEICYWPNLGYGKFGAKVTMDQSPRFDYADRFDPKRIRLSDIDGSGVTDIVYLHPDAPMIYFNQSGNGWSSGQSLPQFPRVDDLGNSQKITSINPP